MTLAALVAIAALVCTMAFVPPAGASELGETPHNLDWALEGGVLVDLFPQRAEDMGEAVSLGLPPFAEY